MTRAKARLAQIAGVPASQVEFVHGTNQGMDEVPQFVDIRVKPEQAEAIVKRLNKHGLYPHPYPVKDGLLSLITDQAAPELYK